MLYTGHFGTLLLLYNLFCNHRFLSCVVLLPTSLAQYSHSYGMDLKCSVLTPSVILVLYDESGQKTRLN